MSTFKETLISLGLEPSAANIYLVLVESGEMSVPQIQEKTGLSRAMIYEVLPELIAYNHVEYRKEGRNAYYKPAHPNSLISLMEQKKRDTVLLEDEMRQTVNSLIGTYNLAFNKPGVRFFEGIDGIKEVLWDSLETKDTIYTMGDLETFIKHSKPINDEYVSERKKRQIHKKAITIDSHFNREFLATYDSELTETKLLKNSVNLFESTIIEMYDDKISYTTFTDESLIGLIIQNKYIHKYQKSIFDYLWKQSIPHHAARRGNSSTLSTWD